MQNLDIESIKSVMNCPLCETQLKNKADEYYFICSNCSAYVKDKKYYITHLQEKERYEQHNNNVDDIRYINFVSPITQVIFEKFNAFHLGLDYGCGEGPVISKILQDKSYKVKLYDPFFYPDLDYLNHQYDYIFSCEVFEHFSQPKQEIEKILTLLKPNGYLLIMTYLYDGVSDFRNWHYRRDQTHVFIYTAKTIKFIEKNFNLSIEKQDDRMIIFRKVQK